MSSAAYLLLAHGSQDPRTTTAFSQLASACEAKLQQHRATPLVGMAYLELAELPILEQLVSFANQAIDHQCWRVRILPLFLAPGVHVLDDLPQAVNQAQAKLSDRSQLELLSYLGDSHELLKILQDQSRQLPTPQILLAHGSQHTAAQEFLANLAHSLQAVPAYWSGSPQLPESVGKLAALEITEIGILPYFLFPGRISAAITATINELQSLLPAVQFRFTQGELEKSLLCQNPQLADLLAQMLLTTKINLKN